MIKHLTRNQLDISKYNSCISNAMNSRIYAYSWYLDITADKKWDVLVLNDYEAVMPLPKRRKYFIDYIFLPSWTQQLGIFSIKPIRESTINEFLGRIPKKFKLVDIYLNSDNRFNSKYLNKRDNYILPLKQKYEELKKQFNKGRKSNINQAEKYDLNIVENYNQDEIIELFKKNKVEVLDAKSIDYDMLSSLISKALSLNHVKSIAVLNNEKELIGGVFFFNDNYRITYLFSVINNEGRKKQVMSLLLNYIIKTNSESNLILDFEGSMIKELASFFNSFGTKKEAYFHYKKYRFL